MEIFQPLIVFFDNAANDARIGATHISVYMALLRNWNLNGCKNPVAIERRSIMHQAKINARHTYNKCMNDLHAYGYIIYNPSVNYYMASTVYLQKLEPNI